MEDPTAAMTYTVADLVRAQVLAARGVGKHPDVAVAYARWHAALSAAFGIDRTADPGDTDLVDLHASTIQQWLTSSSPFSAYLEVSPTIHAMYARHGAEINVRVDGLRLALEVLLADLTTEIWGIPPGSSVSRADVARHGFDFSAVWPDRSDFL